MTSEETTIDWDNISVDDLCAKEGQYVEVYHAKCAIDLEQLLNEYVLTYNGQELHVNWDKLVELGIITYEQGE